MTDAADLRRAVSRAARAKAILEDEQVAEALGMIEANLRQAWEHSKFDDAAGREEAYRMLRAARSFRAWFEQALADGKVAEAEIARNDAAERRKREMSA
jgi:hypothetical protein